MAVVNRVDLLKIGRTKRVSTIGCSSFDSKMIKQ